MRRQTITFLLIAIAAFGFTSDKDFQKLYDYYFPKNGNGVESTVYRPSFDKIASGTPPSRSRNRRGRQVYDAFHGDPRAFHAFVTNRDRDVNGAQGEEWDYESLLLLLRLGDDLFSKLLAHEDRATREAVGIALEPYVDWNKHGFIKTRASYSFRYKRP
jgi:hypothetical protein